MDNEYGHAWHQMSLLRPGVDKQDKLKCKFKLTVFLCKFVYISVSETCHNLIQIQLWDLTWQSAVIITMADDNTLKDRCAFFQILFVNKLKYIQMIIIIKMAESRATSAKIKSYHWVIPISPCMFPVFLLNAMLFDSGGMKATVKFVFINPSSCHHVALAAVVWKWSRV